MTTVFDDLHVIGSSAVQETYSAASLSAFTSATCPNCDGAQMAMIAFTDELAFDLRGSDGYSPEHVWMRCVTCGTAVVRNHSRLAPAAAPLRTPDGLPDIERSLWEQVRNTLAVEAATAAVMLCRKFIFHVAISAGLPPKDDKGWAPTFKQCVNHLESEGVITPNLRPWVDRIVTIGNDANHEIPEIPLETAHDLATFTLQLLVLYYELPAKMKAFDNSHTNE